MTHLSPQTLTRDEQRALLGITSPELRDHLIFSLALGTGLRLGELVGLDVGDIFFPTGVPRERIRVRAAIAKRGRVGDVFLPRALIPKLARFWNYKRELLESTTPHAPLFCGLSRRRISTRRVQVLFHEWQELAGFGRQYPFHSLRHYAECRIMPSGLRKLTLEEGLTSIVAPGHAA